MTATDTLPNDVRAGRASLMVLLVVIGTTLLVDVLARDDGLAAWIHGRWVEKWEGSDNCPPRWPYFDMSDRVFLDRIPNADFSQGAVCFLGSSNLGTAVTPWVLPQERRDLVHYYNVPGSSHTDHKNFVRYLIDHEGFLEAGGDKTLVVMAVFYGSSKRNSWFANAFIHGLHTYDRDRGIEPTGASWLYRLLRTEKVRCRSFLLTCNTVLRLTGDLTFDVDLWPNPWSRPYPKEEFQANWTSRMSPEWDANMDEELRSLEEAIELLKGHQAHAAIALLPSGSWGRELPFHSAFVERVSALAAARSVPLVDLSELLTDDEFSDQVHMNHAGATKSHAALMEIAADHLREIAPPR